MSARSLVALALVLAAGCGDNQPGDDVRREAIRQLGVDVIVPQLFELAYEADPLVIAMQRVAVVTSVPFLDAAQDTWRRARAAWKASEAFGFGPAAELALDAAVDLAGIEAELAGVAVLDEAYIEGLPAGRKGFHALEVLLFRVDGNDTAVRAAIAASPRRGDYLVAVARNAVARIGELRDEWTDEHADRLATAAADDPDYPTVDAAMAALVGRIAAVAARIAAARLDEPGGVTSGAARPELEESAPSDNSVADMADELRGVRNVYYGTRSGEPGGGLGGLVAAVDPETDADARTAIEGAIAAVERIPRPYAAALAERRPEVAAAHAAVRSLARLLAERVAPALGVAALDVAALDAR